MKIKWKHCSIFVLYDSTGGKKRKEAPVHMKGRQSLGPAYLPVVLCGLVTFNYHTQFHGLFYENLLFSLSWIAIKGNVER